MFSSYYVQSVVSSGHTMKDTIPFFKTIITFTILTKRRRKALSHVLIRNLGDVRDETVMPCPHRGLGKKILSSPRTAPGLDKAASLEAFLKHNSGILQETPDWTFLVAGHQGLGLPCEVTPGHLTFRY